MAGTRRADIHPGQSVRIVLKQDQRTGRLTEGVVKNILTKSATHPHGIKVRLTSGAVGRVKAIESLPARAACFHSRGQSRSCRRHSAGADQGFV